MATREAPPPPVIGKAGRYTVFITPPATPRPSESSRSRNPSHSPNLSSPRNVSNLSPKVGDLSPAMAFEKSAAVAAPPPVQGPPPQFEKEKGGKESGSSVFGFFWDAVAKVQDVHSSLDRYFADWLGLDQSRYQWALNDYYENNGSAKDGGKPKELGSKGQAV